MGASINNPISEYKTAVKTITIDGNGAQNDNLFSFTGSIEILSIWGIITSITDITTCTATNFNINDTLNTVQLTTTAGTAISGFSPGSLVMKESIATTAIFAQNASQCRVNDASSSGQEIWSPCIITAGNGLPSNNIRFGFTGDAFTNFEMKFFVRWRPLSDNATLTAV